ncbi:MULTISPECIES: lysoplasmalogenase [Streptomyces]|uniref:lysoplasmalogenase n=1 Tax=Streptomyces TaxID=1883 RepID=UPI0029B0FA46|nr:lysoplasmalogenase [Streptomyces scabiei]MDX3112997.1 lysoplasmalogenase [Streptomyces scabiei]
MTRPRVLLALFASAAAVDLLSLAAGFGPGHMLAKPLLMPLLAAWAARRGAPGLLPAALACGWGGDTLLLLDADPAFLGGMACFAAGHVCYLVLFTRVGRPHARAVALVPCYAVVLIATVVLLWPGLPQELRGPVAVYSALLTAMACAAAVRLGPVAGAGGVLFLLSDTLIATGVAGWPQPPRPDLWIMLTYLAAQFLLVRGVLDALVGRREPAAAYREVRSTTP